MVVLCSTLRVLCSRIIGLASFLVLALILIVPFSPYRPPCGSVESKTKPASCRVGITLQRQQAKARILRVAAEKRSKALVFGEVVSGTPSMLDRFLMLVIFRDDSVSLVTRVSRLLLRKNAVQVTVLMYFTALSLWCNRSLTVGGDNPRRLAFYIIGLVMGHCLFIPRFSSRTLILWANVILTVTRIFMIWLECPIYEFLFSLIVVIVGLAPSIWAAEVVQLGSPGFGCSSVRFGILIGSVLGLMSGNMLLKANDNVITLIAIGSSLIASLMSYCCLSEASYDHINKCIECAERAIFAIGNKVCGVGARAPDPNSTIATAPVTVRATATATSTATATATATSTTPTPTAATILKRGWHLEAIQALLTVAIINIYNDFPLALKNMGQMLALDKRISTFDLEENLRIILIIEQTYLRAFLGAMVGGACLAVWCAVNWDGTIANMEVEEVWKDNSFTAEIKQGEEFGDTKLVEENDNKEAIPFSEWKPTDPEGMTAKKRLEGRIIRNLMRDFKNCTYSAQPVSKDALRRSQGYDSKLVLISISLLTFCGVMCGYSQQVIVSIGGVLLTGVCFGSLLIVMENLRLRVSTNLEQLATAYTFRAILYLLLIAPIYLSTHIRYRPTEYSLGLTFLGTLLSGRFFANERRITMKRFYAL